jgi:hypothetical protein
MNSPNSKAIRPNSQQITFLICALLIIAFNTFNLHKEITALSKIRRQVPYRFMGNKFTGLREILGNVKYVGYYTDKNLDENQPAMQFAQAQYTMAPIILELNNTSHTYTLFDCSSEDIAMKKIQETGLAPIKRNQFGIFLAGQPQTIEKSNSKSRLRVPLFPKMKTGSF